MKLTLAAVLLGLCGMTYGVNMDLLKPFDLYAHYMFVTEDINGDGHLTLTEVHQIFDRYDTNGNGYESRHEYTSFICDADPNLYQISHYLFDAWDVNGDHHLTEVDYDNMFAAMDIDGNGEVINQEFIDYFVEIFLHIETQANQHPHGNSHEHGASACHSG